MGLATLFTTLFTVLAATGGAASASASVSQDQAATSSERADALQPMQAVGAATPASQSAVGIPIPDPGDLWKIAKCAASVTLAFVPAAKAYKAIKALGGVRETAKLLVKAGNSDDFLTIAGGSAAEILGIAGIEANCF
jgi:hypothetical protein